MIASKLFYNWPNIGRMFRSYSSVVLWNEYCWDRFKHKSVSALFCRNSQKKTPKDSKGIFGTNDNVTGGRRTDAAPEMEMKWKYNVNTPSVAQKFSFQTSKQVARGKLAAGLKTKRGLLMSNHRYDDTLAPKACKSCDRRTCCSSWEGGYRQWPIGQWGSCCHCSSQSDWEGSWGLGPIPNHAIDLGFLGRRGSVGDMEGGGILSSCWIPTSLASSELWRLGPGPNTSLH